MHNWKAYPLNKLFEEKLFEEEFVRLENPRKII